MQIFTPHTQAILSTVYISLLAVVGENMAARMRHRLFESLVHQDMAFFDARQTGEIVGRLTNDVQGELLRKPCTSVLCACCLDLAQIRDSFCCGQADLPRTVRQT